MFNIFSRLFAFISLIALLFIGYSVWEAYNLKITTIDFVSQDIPESFTGKKIVFVSDLHQDFYFSQKRTADLVQRINGLSPDIIILGGDYVDAKAEYISSCFQELKNLKAKMGVFGVLGNHDYEASAVLTKKAMQEAGIFVLDNKAIWVYSIPDNQSIKIGGVEDYLKSFPDFSPAINDVQESDFVILVSHNPDFSMQLKNNKIDLVLSGHNHGGQVTFFGKWAYIESPYGQKFRYGLTKTGYTSVYTTSGVGTTFLPLRFFAPPEIVEITLKR